MPLVSGGGSFNGGTITTPLVINDGDGTGVTLLTVTGPHTAFSLTDDGTLTYASDDTAGMTISGTGTTAGIFQVGDVLNRTLYTLSSSSYLAISNGGNTVTRIGRAASTGSLFAFSTSAAPADADLGNSECALWLDATPGATKLMVKAKDSGGTVRTASIALA